VGDSVGDGLGVCVGEGVGSDVGAAVGSALVEGGSVTDCAYAAGPQGEEMTTARAIRAIMAPNVRPERRRRSGGGTSPP
jgi:hypothetical protein